MPNRRFTTDIQPKIPATTTRITPSTRCLALAAKLKVSLVTDSICLHFALISPAKRPNVSIF
jgi:hypothetical protein